MRTGAQRFRLSTLPVRAHTADHATDFPNTGRSDSRGFGSACVDADGAVIRVFFVAIRRTRTAHRLTALSNHN
jgi:hypothetical protein